MLSFPGFITFLAIYDDVVVLVLVFVSGILFSTDPRIELYFAVTLVLFLLIYEVDLDRLFFSSSLSGDGFYSGVTLLSLLSLLVKYPFPATGGYPLPYSLNLFSEYGF